MFSGKYREQIRGQYEIWMEKLELSGRPGWMEAVRKGVEEAGEEIKEALWFLYGAMPAEDASGLSFETVMEFAVHGVWLWEQGPFAGKVPEEVFAEYVLHYRVNDEEIAPCRAFFYERFSGSIDRSSMENSVRNINYRCAEEVSYRLTDDRTSSAMAVYRAGFGRCGEESVFAVNVLRSMGIPARQVYAPYWSHCDDNHAWAEVWCDGEWHFLGACEPEERLDKGWFNQAASRALVITSPCFSASGRMDGYDGSAGRKGMALVHNHIKRYAICVHLRVCVTMPDQAAASGAWVDCLVLNGAAYRPVCSLQTGEDGCVHLDAGRGSLMIAAHCKGYYAEVMLQKEILEREEYTVNISLEELFDAGKMSDHGEKGTEETLKEKETEYTFYAPKSVPVNPGRLTPEEKRAGREKKEAAEQKRREKLAGLTGDRAGLLKAAASDGILQKEFFDSLTEKDLRDASPDVLRRQFKAVEGQQAAQYSEGMYCRYVLAPRIGRETLSAYQEELRELLPQELSRRFCKEKRGIAEWVDSQVKEIPELLYGRLVTAPAETLKSGIGSRLSKNILCVAIYRTLGIPARLSPLDQEAEYAEKEQFIRVSGLPENDVRVMFKGEAGEWRYQTDWSLSRLREGGYRLLYDVPAGEAVMLAPGKYRLITVTRLPDGNILVRQNDFVLEPQYRAAAEITLSRREARWQALLQDEPLEDFYLKNNRGMETSASELTKEGTRVFLWLDPGHEPTEHLFNELLEAERKNSGLKEYLYLIFPDRKTRQDPSARRYLECMPEGNVFEADFGLLVEPLARSMYTDPEKLPFILAVRQGLRGIYAVSGYNIGTADMLTRIIKNEGGNI